MLKENKTLVNDMMMQYTHGAQTEDTVNNKYKRACCVQRAYILVEASKDVVHTVRKHGNTKYKSISART